MAQKIQSHVRGFLFRVRRNRALDKLNAKGKHHSEEPDEIDIMMQDELDFDKFLNVKTENLQAYPNLMMDQAIQAMTKHLKQPLPPLVNVPLNKTQSLINNNDYFYNQQRSKPSSVRDDLSEIEMKSDANSVKSHQRVEGLRKNNLMVTHGDELYDN